MIVDRVTSVEVTVSREAIGGAIHEAAAEGVAEVDPGKRLIIQVLPKMNIEVVGESRAEIDVPATGEPQTVYFDVRATDSGEASLWVVARRGRFRSSRSSSRPASPSPVAHGSVAAADRRWTGFRRPPLASPCTSCESARLERGGTVYYEYELEAPSSISSIGSNRGRSPATRRST